MSPGRWHTCFCHHHLLLIVIRWVAGIIDCFIRPIVCGRGHRIVPVVNIPSSGPSSTDSASSTANDLSYPSNNWASGAWNQRSDCTNTCPKICSLGHIRTASPILSGPLCCTSCTSHCIRACSSDRGNRCMECGNQTSCSCTGADSTCPFSHFSRISASPLPCIQFWLLKRRECSGLLRA